MNESKLKSLHESWSYSGMVNSLNHLGSGLGSGLLKTQLGLVQNKAINLMSPNLETITI